jgi:hypothetical protein
MITDRQERIRERAYWIWIEEGRPQGRSLEHWVRAEREIAQALDASPASAASDAQGTRGATQASRARRGASTASTPRPSGKRATSGAAKPQRAVKSRTTAADK